MKKRIKKINSALLFFYDNIQVVIADLKTIFLKSYKLQYFVFRRFSDTNINKILSTAPQSKLNYFGQFEVQCSAEQCSAVQFGLLGKMTFGPKTLLDQKPFLTTTF